MADRGKVLDLIDALFEAGQEIDRHLLDTSHVCEADLRARLAALRAEIEAVRAILNVPPPITPAPDGTPEPNGPMLSWEPNEFENAPDANPGKSDAADNEYLADDTVKFQAG